MKWMEENGSNYWKNKITKLRDILDECLNYVGFIFQQSISEYLEHSGQVAMLNRIEKEMKEKIQIYVHI